jgi:DNA mismatch repair protein MutS2
MQLDSQSGKDLEFDSVLYLLSSYCKSQKAKENALKLNYFGSPQLVSQEFDILSEIKTIYEEGKTHFPQINAEDIDHALTLLRIENGVLILPEVIKVYTLCLGTKQLIEFATKNKLEAPEIYAACQHIDKIDSVLSIIRSVLDEKKLDIKDTATPYLKEVRSKQKENWYVLNKNFDDALKKCKNEGILGDIVETFLDNRRLLSVYSQHKKQVKGRVRGISAKGIYSYIEPEENIRLNEDQEQLRLEESNELYKILEKLTNDLRAEKNNLAAFQRLLVRFDLMNAKVLFGLSYNGIRPKLLPKKSTHWQNARHPLLFLKNKELGKSTFGQEITMHLDQRFLVISGPNAGGKSITLKTVGLLQMMFQCGLFVPVDETSECCWFEQILSDIGDNQSIENQLSTYSYRLQRMNFFLQHAHQETLLLLDEFGSGTDPELGGALAAVFYEELYQKGVYAVITTHYTNIKILTSSMPQAINACMLFDTKSLEPLYQLSTGQPGSSFTFEVAKYNGIPNSLIEKAKASVSEFKISLDELSVALQKEKASFEKLNTEHFLAKTKANQRSKEFDEKLEQLRDKAERQTQYFEQQNKFITTGKKVFELIKKYKQHKTDKTLIEELKKVVAIEKSKVLASEKPLVFDKNLALPKLPVDQKKSVIKKEVEETSAPIPVVEPIKIQKTYKIGDVVTLKNKTGKATIQEIKGKKLTVIIGNFILNTTLEEIE